MAENSPHSLLVTPQNLKNKEESISIYQKFRVNKKLAYFKIFPIMWMNECLLRP
jgi:hypothetical protein